MLSLSAAKKSWITHYWPLFKSRQTFLLTLTGAAGYLCQQPAGMSWFRFSSVVGSLLVVIAGCSVINMLFDRDIDRMMERTSRRPLAAGQVNPSSAAFLGGLLIGLGLLWAASLSWLYCVVVLAGAALNLLVYTFWLKRRSAWSILWGGVAGGMPILAGRVLAVGHIDLLGVLLALIVVCWIPSHNLTLSTLYATDYITAGVPTFINVYGPAITHRVVILSSLLAALLMLAAFFSLGSGWWLLLVLACAGIVLVGMAQFSHHDPAVKRIKILYKYSSLYMLVSMLLLILNGLK